MRPNPVTKPSPGGRCSSIPKSTQLWRTNLSSSSKLPSSSSRLMRSRAVSLPALCSRSRRSPPPPASASVDNFRNSSMRPLCLDCKLGRLFFFSGKRPSRERGFFFAKNANRQVRGHPHRAQQEHDAEQQLGANGGGALHRRNNGGDVHGGLHQDKHRAEAHDHDQHGSEN